MSWALNRNPVPHPAFLLLPSTPIQFCFPRLSLWCWPGWFATASFLAEKESAITASLGNLLPSWGCLSDAS